MTVNQRSMNGMDYLDILRGYIWWITLLLIMGAGIATLYSNVIPSIYRSSTLIMVERQKVPEGYVQSTVTSTVQERLKTITQQITSRTNLERIIKQFSLNGENVQTLDHDDIVKKWLLAMKDKFSQLKNIKGLMLSLTENKENHQDSISKINDESSIEEFINRMRNNIDIEVIGKDAFTIAYSSRDPKIAMDVTNTLATLFIEENLRVREEEAAETSQFLENELVGAAKELDQHERALKEFKAGHMGSLPQQLDVNLRTLDHLRTELQSTNDLLRAGAESLADIQDGVFFNRKSIIDGKQGFSIPNNPLITKRDALLEELARLRAEFNENYPDIIVIKQQVADIERVLTGVNKSTDAGDQSPSSSPQKGQSRAQSIKLEVEGLKEKQKKLTSQINEYQKRVEDTFANEQRLASLTRDYETSQNHYYKLLEKKLNAKSSENLEKWQKSERFRILDPANLPETPFKPNRGRIILVGSLFGGCLGAGLSLFKEFRHPCFRKAEDLQGLLDVPVLVTIPRNTRNLGGRSRIVTLGQPVSVMADQYRVLYTKINHLLKEEAPTIFAISSSIKGEGKSLTTLNLAIVAAKDFGKRTLIIEGDLKNPTLSRYLNIKTDYSLLNILMDNIDINSALIEIVHDYLHVLPAGTSLQNSSALLSSSQMKDLIAKLRNLYDVILVDSPPILPLPDMNIIEEIVDGIILVVRAESTTRNAFLAAIDSLATHKFVGTVLNDVRRPLPQHYHYTYKQV